jgi:UDP-N-acetylmuramoyl-tripeptide--D-alanyl-D-alanine ligase
MNIEELHQLFLKSSGICTDTRKIHDNCLFFALKGDNFNGNLFAEEAVKKGAKFAVVDEADAAKTEQTILCADSLETLQKLAQYHRKYLDIPIVALTGSNGKTTTKELINAVLSQKYTVTATKGNLNNHIGVPLTLLSMDSNTEMGIVEMGANNFNEIDNLCRIALPDFGYITNFGKAHLEGFGSLEGVVKAKTELYRHLSVHDKLVFVNAEDPKQLKLTQEMKRFIFGGRNRDCTVNLKDASDHVQVRYDTKDIKSKLIGLYNFSNIAAAIAIGDYFGIPSEDIRRAIENYVPSNNRSQVIKKATNKIILDAYNANPTSMLAAIENFKQAKGERKALILGDMFELGNDAQHEHQNITTILDEEPFGTVYLVGRNFKNTKHKADHILQFESFEDLANHLKKHPLNNRSILIKGSRGMALERVLDLV